MSDLNLSVFGGRLGADAEVRHTVTGKAVVRFRVANTRRFTDSLGRQQTRTTWLNVVAWNGVASGIAEYLVKGKQVTVIGSLEQSEWEDRDGNKRTTIELNAKEIHLGADPRDDDGNASRKSNGTSSRRRERYEEYDEADDDESEEEAPW